MNYDNMSDFEINKAVALLYPFSESKCLGYDPDKVFIREHPEDDPSGEMSFTEYDPCNNPSDAWPIIEANNISVQNWDDYSRAWVSDNCDIEFHDEESCRGLRAAMIVYLMMQESK